jgi:hypothetical protein
VHPSNLRYERAAVDAVREAQPPEISAGIRHTH